MSRNGRFMIDVISSRKLYVRVLIVYKVYEISEFFCTMVPDEKDIVDIAAPQVGF